MSNDIYFYLTLTLLWIIYIFGIVKTPLSRYSTEKILKEFYKRSGTQPLAPGVECVFNIKGLPSDYHLKHMAATLDLRRKLGQHNLTVSWPKESS